MRLTLDGERQKLPDGQVLNAEIVSVKQVEKPWVDNKTGEKAIRIAFEFLILDDEYAGRRHWEDLFTSFYPSEKCRLYLWTLKILGRDELPEGFTLDTSAFEGAKVPIMMSTRHYTKKDGTPGSSQEANVLSAVEAQSLRAAGGLQSDAGQPQVQPLADDAPLSYDPEEPF